MKILTLIILTLITLLGIQSSDNILQTAAQMMMTDREVLEVQIPTPSPSAAVEGDAMNNTIQDQSLERSGQEILPQQNRIPGLPLFNFNGQEPGWYAVNDNVMGGISNGRVQVDPTAQQLSFSGDVSLENNGGFASTRTDWMRYNLEGYDGILMNVLGDGSTYRFRIRSAQTGTEVAYTALFETKAGQWQDVFIPFADMVPTYRGYIIPNAPALDPATIRSFGLMITDKQEGQFSLTIDWINAVRVKRSEISYAADHFGLLQAPSLVFSQDVTV